VLDLQLIWIITTVLAVCGAILAIFFVGDWQLMHPVNQVQNSFDKSSFHYFVDFLITYLGLLGPILAVLGAITAWVYRTGSSRLGVVDLFACEISTLCRVGTVADVATRLAKAYEAEPTSFGHPADQPLTDLGRFASEEHYFPVFDSNSRDLQVLESRIVTHITAFYTFMKAMRDSRRKFDEMKHMPLGDDPNDPWHRALMDVIYMMFLAFESARKAINDLIEFEPEEAECTATILLTELDFYRFLLSKIAKNDFRYGRLLMRLSEYQKVVPTLSKTIRGGQGDDWLPAQYLLPELQARYDRLQPHYS
jgi:hypothetical protein